MGNERKTQKHSMWVRSGWTLSFSTHIRILNSKSNNSNAALQLLCNKEQGSTIKNKTEQEQLQKSWSWFPSERRERGQAEKYATASTSLLVLNRIFRSMGDHLYFLFFFLESVRCVLFGFGSQSPSSQQNGQSFSYILYLYYVELWKAFCTFRKLQLGIMT